MSLDEDVLDLGSAGTVRKFWGKVTGPCRLLNNQQVTASLVIAVEIFVASLLVWTVPGNCAAAAEPATAALPNPSSPTRNPKIRPRGGVQLQFIGRFRHSEKSGTSATEITAFDPSTRQLFVVNVEDQAIDVLDLSQPALPVRVDQIYVSALGIPTSVSARAGRVVASVAAEDRRQRGHVVLIDPARRKIIHQIEVGYEPDCVALTNDGKLLVVANEGSPNENYDFDPEGTISLIEIPDDLAQIANAEITTIDFRRYNDDPEKMGPGVRIFGPQATVAQDLEPEYITISADSQRAWVSLQENNAIATIDLEQKSLISVQGLGYKDHSQPGNGFDASDRDQAINIRPWPVKGLYQPDGLANFVSHGKRYLVTANDGKDRDYEGFSERAMVSDLQLDPRRFPQATELQKPENLGRLRVSKTTGDLNGNGLIDELHAFGGRSFSIWDEQFHQVFDSGDQFESIVASQQPHDFNSDHEKREFDSRSAAKGPEPESVVVTEIGTKKIAIIGLERQSGLMVYDVTNPAKPVFEQFLSTRSESTPSDIVSPTGHEGDLGPEGLLVIPAQDSPTKTPLLVVANEISNTTVIYEIRLRTP
ncbi:hypothetical protein A6X21_15200 [Planctopirus hydrillae]|uniref:Choice-of-anchor I domain-containing protein n=1 Tax=Planctopirus hydrillae TaxID=1841610 RepID=A0A1C3E3R9_9PLAN|nr:hypothetical protein A6X21_15200 [Planctopirus hydrillae]